MSMQSQVPPGLSIRLARPGGRGRDWEVVVRNDGEEEVGGLEVIIEEGGIPCPGDFGSTIGTWSRIEVLGPSEERRYGPFSFVKGAQYLGMPLKVRFYQTGGDWLLKLQVMPKDFDRLETLGAEELPMPPMPSLPLDPPTAPAPPRASCAVGLGMLALAGVVLAVGARGEADRRGPFPLFEGRANPAGGGLAEEGRPAPPGQSSDGRQEGDSQGIRHSSPIDREGSGETPGPAR